MIKMDVKFNTKKYGISSIGLTGIMLIIFAIIGGIMGGLTGMFVGILMILFIWVISWSVLIPFVGIFIFVWLFNAGMAYILTLAPTMTGLLLPTSLPYMGLFWFEVICGSIACILVSVIAVVVIIAGLAAVLSND
jgi:hypothetical protein